MKNVKLLLTVGILSLTTIGGYAAGSSTRCSCPAENIRVKACSRMESLCNDVTGLIDSSSFAELSIKLDQLSVLTEDVSTSCNTKKMKKFIALAKKIINERKNGKFTQRDKDLLKSKLKKAHATINQELCK